MKRHVTIYVEGGSKGALATECRRGFSLFFERLGLADCRRMPKIVACGSRQVAYKDFCTAMRANAPNEFPLLLVDSEGPVSETPWRHVLQREGDGWKQPDGATDNHLHFMVQVMESWFLADRDVLSSYFGSEFKENKLPALLKGTDLKSIAKTQVLEGLKAATKECGREKTYHKGRHSFQILGKISPERVADASEHAKRLITQLKNASTP